MKKFVKFVPKKLLNTLQAITYPKGISIDKCVTVAHLILYQKIRTFKKGDNKNKFKHPDFAYPLDVVEMSGQLFKAAIGANYLKVIKFMIDNNLIITDNYYKAEGYLKCKSYCINPNQIDLGLNKLVEWVIEDNTLNKHTQNAINIVEDQKRRPKKNDGNLTTSEIISHIHNLQYDSAAALDWLEYLYNNKIPFKGEELNEDQILSIELKIKNLQKGNTEPKKYRYVKRNNTNGRVDSDITTLNSNFKRFIKGDLVSIDSTASQPTLLLVLIELIKNPLYVDGLWEYITANWKNSIFVPRTELNKSRYVIEGVDKLKVVVQQKIKLPNEANLKGFRKVVEKNVSPEITTPDFYTTIVDNIVNTKPQAYLDKLFPKGCDKRNIVKQLVIMELYNDKQVEFIMIGFPELGKFINNIKTAFKELSLKNNPKQKDKLCRMFSITMQLIESYIWIEKIAKALDAECIEYYTVHDSVIVADKYRSKVEEIIEKIYKSFGVNVKLSVEPLSTILEFKKGKKIEKVGFNIGEPTKREKKKPEVILPQPKKTTEIKKDDPLDMDEISKLFE